MLTPRQFAEAKQVAYTTVMFWLNQGLIEEAEKRETPTGHYWEIPATAVKTFQRPKSGRPKKADEDAPDTPAVTRAEMKAGDAVKTPPPSALVRTQAKKATNGAVTSKPAKKRATKK